MPRRISSRRSRAVILFATVPFAAVFSSSRALGSSFTWGGSTGNWSVPGNWTGNAAPVGNNSSDTLLFQGAAASNYTATNNLAANPSTFSSITLNSTSTNVETLTGTGLTLNGGIGQIIQNGTGAFDIFNNVAFPFFTTFGGTGTGDVTLAGALSGAGGLNKAGPGTLTLSGASTRSGPTTISAGTLAVASDSELGSGVSLVGGTLQLNSYSSSLTVPSFSNLRLGAGSGAPATFGGLISNLSSFNYVGPGTLILSNTNTYNATTTLTAGTLAITSDAGLGNSVSSVSFAGGVLQFNGYKSTRSFSSVPNLKLGAGTGAPATLAGTLSSSGSLTYVGPGTLTLASAGSYNGGTTLVAGALAIGSDTALNSIPTFAGGALQFNNYSSNRTFGNIPNLTLGAATGAASTFNGSISGTSSFTFVGPGTLIFSGNTSNYSGGTTLAGGTLGFNSSSSFGGNSHVPAFAGGVLQFDNTSVSSLTFAGVPNLKLGAAIGSSSSLSSPISGSLPLTFVGPGTLELSGVNNSFSGAITLAGGILGGNSSSNFGTGPFIFAGGTLELNTSTNYAFADQPLLKLGVRAGSSGSTSGLISGTTSLTFAGPGTFTLSNNTPGALNSYTGGTTLIDGSLGITNDSALGTGPVTFAGGALAFSNYTSNLSFNNNPNLKLGAIGSSTLAGSITGTSALNFVGPGVLLLSSSGNNYTGGTTLSGGAFAITADSFAPPSRTFAGGALQLNNYSSNLNFPSIANLTLGANIGANSTLAGAITGTSPLTFVGPGNLVLSGANTYTGGTTLAGGTVIIPSDSALGTGPITPAGGNLQFDHYSSQLNFANFGSVSLGASSGAPSTFTGVISGGTNLIYTGPGTLVMQTINTYRGQTEIAAGTLVALKDSLSVSGFGINIDPNGTLQASGIVQRGIFGSGTLTATGSLAIGVLDSLGAVNFGGTLNVGSNSVLFLSEDLSHLSGQVNLADGAHLNSFSGLQLDSTAVLNATGAFTVDGPFTNLGSLGSLGLIVTGAFTQSSPIPANVGALSGSGSVTASPNTTLAATTVSLAALTLQSGATATLAAHSGVSTLNSLSIAPAATLDVADNVLILNYTGASPAATIRSYLITGFNAGNWNGAGISSSAASDDATFLTAPGYSDNGSSVTVKYTYYGDNNLDGVVNTTDFQMFLDGLVATNAGSWSQGDYTYDGHVDLGNDFNLFLINYLSQGGALGDLAPIVLNDSTLSAAQRAQLLASVPEPSAVAALTGISVMIASRRRRRDCNCR